MGDQHEEAELEAEQLREAIWRLVELQQQAHLPEEAADSVGRWRAAGGDAQLAAERIAALQLRPQPPASPGAE